ncbi:MAG: sugar transporter [Microbacterium sp.]|uniref:MFS transporter n=1 Tax=Microbacterium sp. TaxID=51671 RepID=UPI002610EF28|nr:MFS transporter [Microbacterium sp.]MDF2562727.1 sugar transporter [Microbacterium sp.]
MSHDSRATKRASSRRLRGHPVPRPTHRTPGPPFPRLGLLVLAAAIFVSMSTEFLPGGLVPNIAQTFDRPVTDVGQLITVFAGAVILTTTPLAVLTRRMPRKPLAIIALVGIAAATSLTALAPTFEMLLIARAAGGVAHGLFWSVAAAYAADLVPSSQLGRATAITAAGGSVAGVLGVPLGNALGQAFGWRVAFGSLAAVAVLVVLMVALLLPAVTPSPLAPRRASARDASTRSALGGILLVCAIILLVVIGQTTYGTYSVVWLGEVAAVPSAAIPAFLFGTGLAAFVAVSGLGRIADRFPNGAVPVAVGLLAVLSALFPLAAAWGIGALVVTALLQAMAFAVVPILLQTRMMRITPPHQRATAAALQTTAFNIAIGGGAVVGALAVGAWGLGSLPWVAAVLPMAGLIVLLLTARSTPSHAEADPLPSSTHPEVHRVP